MQAYHRLETDDHATEMFWTVQLARSPLRHNVYLYLPLFTMTLFALGRKQETPNFFSRAPGGELSLLRMLRKIQMFAAAPHHTHVWWYGGY